MTNAAPQYNFHALDNVKIWDMANHTREEGIHHRMVPAVWTYTPYTTMWP